jgi:hypothetical protein
MTDLSHLKESENRWSNALNGGVVVCKDINVLCNKCAELLDIGAYQEVRQMAEIALQIDPNHVMVRNCLATALYQLRSYTAALNVLLPVKEAPNIQSLFGRLLICVEENQNGEYNIDRYPRTGGTHTRYIKHPTTTQCIHRYLFLNCHDEIQL